MLPGNTITAGHTYFGSSETEVEPTSGLLTSWDFEKLPSSRLFKIMRRPPRAGRPVSAMSKINKKG